MFLLWRIPFWAYINNLIEINIEASVLLIHYQLKQFISA